MKQKFIDLTEDQKTELKFVVIANGYKIAITSGASMSDEKLFGLIANMDVLTGIMKVALCSQEQFEIIQKAIYEAKKSDEKGEIK